MNDFIILEDLSRIKEAVKRNYFENKKVLVTGGAGFIGSWLCDVLVDFGAKTTIVDDFSTGREKNIDHLRKNSKFSLIECNVSSFNSDERFDYIFHLAGHASPDEYQARPIETLKTSAFGTANIAELARKSGSILLFSSTSEVYGDAAVVPTPETYWGNVNPVGQRSCYDEGKRFAEALLVAYGKQFGLDIRIARIFNSYGPRLREDGLYGRAVSRFILQALTNQAITVYGDGHQTRSFCYITDTVSSLLLLMSEPKAKGDVVNIGNDMEITILELALKVKEITKCESAVEFLPLPKDDPRRRQPNISKLEKLTGLKPQVNIEEGLKRTIEWFSNIS